MAACPSCGRENAGDARFCSSCGTALASAEPAREQRKVVTVLFCDLVGSTALGESTTRGAARAHAPLLRGSSRHPRAARRHRREVRRRRGHGRVRHPGLARGRRATRRSRRSGDAGSDRGARARGAYRCQHGRGRRRRRVGDARHRRRCQRRRAARAVGCGGRDAHRRRDASCSFETPFGSSPSSH